MWIFRKASLFVVALKFSRTKGIAYFITPSFQKKLYFTHYFLFIIIYHGYQRYERKNTLGPQYKEFREMLSIKRDALTIDLEDDWNQQKISLLEQKEMIDDAG